MLPKSQRLTRGFDLLFRRGEKIITPFFILRAVPAWDEIPRLAVTVSKKTEKTAVRRNRIRRRLIAGVQVTGYPDCSKKPFRIVLLGREEVLRVDFPVLTQALQDAFTRVSEWRFPEKPQK